MSRRSRRRRPWLVRLIGAALSILFIAIIGIAALVFGARMPANTLPWRMPDLDAELRWFPLFQINRLGLDEDLCHEVLEASHLAFTRVPDRPMKNGCGLVGGVVIQRSQIAYSGVFESSCALAAALYWYERDLEALAEEHLGQRITRIDHFGSYACRNVNSERDGRRSEHARANAIDVSGFRLEDGSSVAVEDHWAAATAKGRFLTAARDRACRYFNVVLSPDYNAYHANHLHLDLGPARICR